MMRAIMLPTIRSALHLPAFAIAAALVAAAPAGLDVAGADRPDFSGTWTLNKSLSTPAGSVPTPDADPDQEPDTDQIGRGVYGRRGAFGSGGRGGRGGRGAGDFRQREADRAARHALMQELMAMPASLTIAQDGDRLAFTDGDGILRVYVADNGEERHQLLNGTIETRSRWDDDVLVMELKPRDGVTVTRRYSLRPGAPARLEIATRTDRDRKGVQRLAVYEHVEGGGGPPITAAAPDPDSPG
jgi:hypothetical protein